MTEIEKTFQLDPQGVSPERIPKHRLSTGACIPAIGMGTFGSDRFSGESIAQAVLEAARLGYRHFDCASIYGNEQQIGKSFRQLVDLGLARQELWITSKVWNDCHGEGAVRKSCVQSLADLQIDYLDLYLVHWPFPNHHPRGCEISYRAPNAQAYIHENFMQTWRQMEALVDEGLVRHIGTSNMTRPKLELLLRDARIAPVVNEMELHPHFQQPQLFEYVRSRAIVPIGFCPIGSPTRPERDRSPDDTVDIMDPVIVQIAERLGVHPAVVCVKWAVQRGQIPIPFSIYRDELLANIQSTVSEPLSDEEMAAIAGIDRNNRLIKGTVFLWKENQNWHDLWDEEGTITPP